MLSSFQNKCEEAIDKTVRSIGLTLVQREVRGDREKFVHAHVEGSAIEVWIYIDGAEFTGPETDFRYEFPDFNSADELIRKMGVDLLGQLQKKQITAGSIKN